MNKFKMLTCACSLFLASCINPQNKQNINSHEVVSQVEETKSNLSSILESDFILPIENNEELNKEIQEYLWLNDEQYREFIDYFEQILLTRLVPADKTIRNCRLIGKERILVTEYYSFVKTLQLEYKRLWWNKNIEEYIDKLFISKWYNWYSSWLGQIKWHKMIYLNTLFWRINISNININFEWIKDVYWVNDYEIYWSLWEVYIWNSVLYLVNDYEDQPLFQITCWNCSKKWTIIIYKHVFEYWDKKFFDSTFINEFSHKIYNKYFTFLPIDFDKLEIPFTSIKIKNEMEIEEFLSDVSSIYIDRSDILRIINYCREMRLREDVRSTQQYGFSITFMNELIDKLWIDLNLNNWWVKLKTKDQWIKKELDIDRILESALNLNYNFEISDEDLEKIRQEYIRVWKWLVENTLERK